MQNLFADLNQRLQVYKKRPSIFLWTDSLSTDMYRPFYTSLHRIPDEQRLLLFWTWVAQEVTKSLVNIPPFYVERNNPWILPSTGSILYFWRGAIITCGFSAFPLIKHLSDFCHLVIRNPYYLTHGISSLSNWQVHWKLDQDVLFFALIFSCCILGWPGLLNHVVPTQAFILRLRRIGIVGRIRIF